MCCLNTEELTYIPHGEKSCSCIIWDGTESRQLVCTEYPFRKAIVCFALGEGRDARQTHDIDPNTKDTHGPNVVNERERERKRS